ncbi:MAG: MtrB/PioB family outer membrane beta-barrel protein [Pseudomonadota bacterium]
MKKKYIAMIAVLALLLPHTVFAEEDAAVSSSVELGFRVLDNLKRSAKFQEYRDLDDGTFVNIGLDAYKGSYYFEAKGTDIGLSDQNYQLKGGKYGRFKYSLTYDETPHNYTFDAKSFYSGIGTNVLSYDTAAPAAESNWSSFDYSIRRKDSSGEIEVLLGSPFYVNVGVNKVETTGGKPHFFGNFTNRVEVPEPVDHTTDNLMVKAGYRSRDYLIELSGLLSSFDNADKYLTWESPTAAGTTYQAGLPPDNDYSKLAAKFVWKNLPYASTFAVNTSYAKLENDLTINPELQAANPAYPTTFSGDIRYTNLSTALTSRPTKALDTRVYYSYLDRDNNASLITTDESNEPKIFQYTKEKLGAEVGYRFPKSTKVSLGYDYTNLRRRNRTEFPSTTDHSYTAQVKNTALDYLTAKLQYKHLERDSEADIGATVAVFDFDAADKSVDEIKLGFEVYPRKDLDIALEYTHASNDYDQPVLANGEIRGREKDDMNAVYLDILWRLPRNINLSGFAGYERREVDSSHNNGGSAPYTQSTEDDLWTYGLTGKIRRLMDNKLDLIVRWEYEKSDGESNFGVDGTLQNIPTLSDYTKRLLEAKAVYAFAKKLDVTLGYLHEKYKYGDLAYEGYLYTEGTSWLSGAYADQNYQANIGYVTLKYSF